LKQQEEEELFRKIEPIWSEEF